MYRFCLLALVVLSGQVHAWGFTGHKALCQAAYELTRPQTQKVLDAVAKSGAYPSFAEACTWADDIKKDHQWDWSKPLHYINVSRQETALSSSDCPSKGCVISAIREQQTTLQQHPHDWQALFFLAHFIGDLHQPMHVSYADDLGGNKTEVSFFGKATNLHGVWDYGIIEQLVGDDWRSLGHSVAQQARDTFAQSTAQNLGSPTQWGDESLALTQEIYAQYVPQQSLGLAYVTQHQGELMAQMSKGAVRLAVVLEQIYQP